MGRPKLCQAYHWRRPSCGVCYETCGRLLGTYRGPRNPFLPDSNPALAVIALNAIIDQLGMVASTIGTRSNTPLRFLPLTIVLVVVAVAVAISIGRTREPGRSRGDDPGRWRDRPAGPPPPVKPSHDRGLPGWLGALDGELADEPRVRVRTKV